MRIIVNAFIYIHYLLNECGIKIRGLGKIQRLLKREFLISIYGKLILFSPGIEGSYDYLLIKKSNEPETTRLLSKVFSEIGESNFIDVGASVGEFVTYVSCFDNVRRIYAFEPRPECAAILKKNAMLNKDERITVIEKALSNCKENISFYYNGGGTSSGFFKTEQPHSSVMIVNAIPLDSVIMWELKNTVMLVDVEGAEPMVLKGSSSFISRNKPLIIFEYNKEVSKKIFKLDHIQEILGDHYSIYRVCGDGYLDKNFEKSWNCVAIHEGSEFKSILGNYILQI